MRERGGCSGGARSPGQARAGEQARGQVQTIELTGWGQQGGRVFAPAAEEESRSSLSLFGARDASRFQAVFRLMLTWPAEVWMRGGACGQLHGWAPSGTCRAARGCKAGTSSPGSLHARDASRDRVEWVEADGVGARSWHLGASKAAYGRVWGGVWLAHAPWTAPPTSRCYTLTAPTQNFRLQENDRNV